MKEILVTRSSMPTLNEYINEIASLWDSHWLTNMGVKHQEFEEQLKAYLHVEDIALYTNGHSALECALEALCLHGKVITTPFTFASTAHAIVRKGLKPLFADIKPDDYTLDPTSIEKLIDCNTCAIVPVHVYGNLCDVEMIQEIAEKYNLKIIYDAAHAFGIEKNGISAASYGDISMLSFHATKVFNSIEGGALCFKDPALRDKLNQWKNFGITGPESVEYIGSNAKMNEFCAAMGICNLRNLDSEIEERKVIAERYWNNLENIEGLTFHRPKSDVKHNYAYLPMVVESSFGVTRDQVFNSLECAGIHARKYFYPLISDYACYKGQFNSLLTPVAQRISEGVMTLPMYADLQLSEVDAICDVIVESRKKYCNNQKGRDRQ